MKMTIPIVFCVSMLMGCAYVQPSLVELDSERTQYVLDRASNLADSYSVSGVEMVSDGKDRLDIRPYRKDLEWQEITYSKQEVTALLSEWFASNSEGTISCQVSIIALDLSHEIRPSGMNYWDVRLRGEFNVTATCGDKVYSDQVSTKYITDYYFGTPSRNSLYYSEALVGIAYNAISEVVPLNTPY